MSHRYYETNLIHPNFTGAQKFGVSDERQELNAPDGRYFAAWTDRTDRILQMQFQTFTPTEWAEFRGFFDRQAGRAKAFYQSSWQHDFELDVVAPAGSRSITVAGHWHSVNLTSNRPDSIGRRIAIVDQTGAFSVHWVTDAVSAGARDILTLEDPIPADLEPGLCCISICYLCRLADDTLTAENISPWHARCELTFREITNRRRFNQTEPVAGLTVGSLTVCGSVVSVDVDPTYPDARATESFGPNALDVPQATNFVATWSAELDPGTNLVEIDGPGGAFTSELYTAPTPAEKLTLAFDHLSKPVLAWDIDGRVTIAWFDGSDVEQVTFDGFSPAGFNNFALARITDIANSMAVVFYLKRGDYFIFFRRRSENFATEHRYCASPLAPISLHRVVVIDAEMQIIGMEAAHREAAWTHLAARWHGSDETGVVWDAFGDLTISYIWASGVDLDTTTSIGDESVGFKSPAWPPSNYMAWTGDDTDDGGIETVVVDLAQAFNDGAITTSAVILCRADWYPPAGGSGPATFMVQYNGVTYGPVAIAPGTGVTPAASLMKTVTVLSDGTFNVT